MSLKGVEKATKAYSDLRRVGEELQDSPDRQDRKLGELLEIALSCIQDAFLKASLGSGI